MPVDPPGSVPDAATAGEASDVPASGARVAAPRAGGGGAPGPRRPPRPDRPTPNGPGFGRGTKPTTPLPTGAAIVDEPTGEFEDLGPGVAAPGAPRPRPAGARPAGTGTTTTIPGTVHRRGRRRGRRVRRVVRRIDLWSVLKLSLVVYTCLYAAVMGTLAAVWAFAYSSGSIDKLESFLGDVGLDNFHFYGDRMFRACAAVGAVGVLSGTVITVLTTALIDVISEVTGGIRLVVIEEDVPVP